MAAPKNPARGSKIGVSRLNAEVVREIRANRSGQPAHKLASNLGVHVNTIWRIQNYETWGWVE